MPNVAFQLGVCSALEEWGFRIPTGCLEPDEEREFGPNVLNPIIGSSSGAFAAVTVAMGYGRDDLMGDSGRIRPMDESVIKDSVDTGLWSLLKRLYSSREKYTRLKKLVRSSPSRYEHIVNTYYPIWKMDALEQYVREELLSGGRFEQLRARLFVLSVAQEQRLTFIFGDKNKPVEPKRDYKFQDGVDPWQAVAGSMCLPPFYKPYRLEDPPDEMRPEGGSEVVLIDGETRDPFSTDAAEDSGADLVFVSSFYRLLEYSPELGHIDDYGILPVILQERAQGKDARKMQSILSRSRRKEALDYFRKFLEQECPDRCEEAMREMEKILDFREDVDVIEIQAQDYEHEELTYPYWDPFTLDEDVVEFQYQAGLELTRRKLEERLVPLTG